MGRPNTLIVIPAFNEAGSIGQVIKGIPRPLEIVVVDDGSTDSTSQVVNKTRAHLLQLKKNAGYDSALMAGMKYGKAKGFDYVITMDADGEHPSKVLEEFILALKGGSDLVVGERKKFNRISEKFISYCSGKFFGKPDPFSGMKGYSLEMLSCKFFNQKTVDRTHFGTQLYSYFVEMGAKISIVSVQTSKRVGPSRIGDSLHVSTRLIASWLRLIFVTKK